MKKNNLQLVSAIGQIITKYCWFIVYDFPHCYFKSITIFMYRKCAQQQCHHPAAAAVLQLLEAASAPFWSQQLIPFLTHGHRPIAFSTNAILRTGKFHLVCSIKKK
jgi:hypothetical protein